MLKRYLRLPASTHFPSGKSISTTHFALKQSPNGLQYNRFGFIVSKSINKRANKRNRTKRVIRSVIEEHLGELKPGHDFLFILRKSIIKKTPLLEQEVLQVLQKTTVS